MLPLVIKGIKILSDNPFKFEFVVTKGDNKQSRPGAINSSHNSRNLTNSELKQESEKLIKYFLAALTTPEKDLWVNLSPYEKDRIVPESFGQTEMGRDLLAQDYLLKQLTASLVYPEGDIGKQFWKRVYEEANKSAKGEISPRHGLGGNVLINTFNKVWIVPEKATVYENVKAGTAYVVESRLKVMTESDYLADSNNLVGVRHAVPQQNAIIQEVVIPQLTKEVNEGKNFAQLRQVYNSLILATWYKKKIKDSILAQVYADKNKVKGIEYKRSIGNNQPNDVDLIYQKYLQAFKKGAYNYIKEEQDPVTYRSIPRKYFSGGLTLRMDGAMVVTKDPVMLRDPIDAKVIKVNLQEWGPFPASSAWGSSDAAMRFEIVKGGNLPRGFKSLISRLTMGDIPNIQKLAWMGFEDQRGLADWIEGSIAKQVQEAVLPILKHPLTVLTRGTQTDYYVSADGDFGVKLIKQDFKDMLGQTTLKAYELAKRKLGGLVVPFLITKTDIGGGQGIVIAMQKVRPVSDKDIRRLGRRFVERFLETIFLYAQRNIFDHDLKIDRFGIDAKGELVVLDPGVTEPLADAVIRESLNAGIFHGRYFYDTFHIAVDKLYDTKRRLDGVDPELGEYLVNRLREEFGVDLSRHKIWFRERRGGSSVEPLAKALKNSLLREFFRRHVQGDHYVYPFIGTTINKTIEQKLLERLKERNGDQQLFPSGDGSSDAAMNIQSRRQTPGGIDLKADKMNLETKSDGGDIEFHVDPVMLKRFQKTSGFVPVIIQIEPLADLRFFLGIGPGK